MRKLPPPSVNVREVLKACRPNLSKRSERSSLTLALASAAKAERQYHKAAKRRSLHSIAKKPIKLTGISHATFARIYKEIFSRRGTAAREIYDTLRNAAPYNRCPLCGQRDVATLDHYLAKSHHVSLSVTPANLIPACAQCNKTKGAHKQDEEHTQTLHPYFEDPDSAIWLRARIISRSPAALQYYIESPSEWNDTMSRRVVHHFELFQLGKLYASHADEEISLMRSALSRLGSSAGAVAVRSHLEEQALSFESVYRNSWKGVMFRTLSASPWFCGGGYDAT